MFKQSTYKALAISLFIFSLFILGLINTYLKSHVEEDLFSIEYINEEELPSPEEEAEEVQEEKAKLETHRAYNEAQEHRERLDQQIKNSAKEFEARMQAMEDALKNSEAISPPPSETNIESLSLNKEVIHNENVHKQSSIVYNLPNRLAINLPNPVYTCYSNGVIVINITVNSIGKVIHSYVDNFKSSSTDKCLTDRALEYANQTRFNTSESSKDNQTGTITYSFVGS